MSTPRWGITVVGAFLFEFLAVLTAGAGDSFACFVRPDTALAWLWRIDCRKLLPVALRQPVAIGVNELHARCSLQAVGYLAGLRLARRGRPISLPPHRVYYLTGKRHPSRSPDFRVH